MAGADVGDIKLMEHSTLDPPFFLREREIYLGIPAGGGPCRRTPAIVCSVKQKKKRTLPKKLARTDPGPAESSSFRLRCLSMFQIVWELNGKMHLLATLGVIMICI